MVEYGLLARGEDHRLAGEAAAIRKLLADAWARGEAPVGSQRTADNGRAATARSGLSRPTDSPQQTSSSQQQALPSQRRTVMFPINETMGQYSELFMLLAAGTYAVAFIAFAWDLAKSSKTLRPWT